MGALPDRAPARRERLRPGLPGHGGRVPRGGPFHRRSETQGRNRWPRNEPPGPGRGRALDRLRGPGRARDARRAARNRLARDRPLVGRRKPPLRGPLRGRPRPNHDRRSGRRNSQTRAGGVRRALDGRAGSSTAGPNETFQKLTTCGSPAGDPRPRVFTRHSCVRSRRARMARSRPEPAGHSDAGPVADSRGGSGVAGPATTPSSTRGSTRGTAA